MLEVEKSKKRMFPLHGHFSQADSVLSPQLGIIRELYTGVGMRREKGHLCQDVVATFLACSRVTAGKSLNEHCIVYAHLDAPPI